MKVNIFTCNIGCNSTGNVNSKFYCKISKTIEHRQQKKFGTDRLVIFEKSTKNALQMRKEL